MRFLFDTVTRCAGLHASKLIKLAVAKGVEMVQYQHAQYKEDVFNISDVTQGDRNKEFTCLGCGRELIPVLGDIKERHFRHKAELTCSGETYLHNLAKHRFHDAYSKCLEEKKPFMIHVSRQSKCTFYEQKLGSPCLSITNESFDLTKWFSEPPLLESRHGEFIPDVLLKSGKGVPLFVEIKVSHACSQDKIDSGHRIMEIEVNSVEDTDFSNGVGKDSSVSLFNFNLEKSFNCRGVCDRNDRHEYKKRMEKERIENARKEKEDRIRRYLAFHNLVDRKTLAGKYLTEKAIEIYNSHREKIRKERKRMDMEDEVREYLTVNNLRGRFIFPFEELEEEDFELYEKYLAEQDRERERRIEEEVRKIEQEKRVMEEEERQELLLEEKKRLAYWEKMFK